MPRSHEIKDRKRPDFAGDGGFTLVEMLTVAALIAILSTVAVASTRGGKKVAYETRAIAAMKNIAENEFMYYQRYSKFGTWNEMASETDLVDPGYTKVDDLTNPIDTPIANLYSIAIQVGWNGECFTAVAYPVQKEAWNLRTYAITCEGGGILNSKDNGRFFSTLHIH